MTTTKVDPNVPVFEDLSLTAEWTVEIVTEHCEFNHWHEFDSEDMDERRHAASCLLNALAGSIVMAESLNMDTVGPLPVSIVRELWGWFLQQPVTSPVFELLAQQR